MVESRFRYSLIVPSGDGTPSAGNFLRRKRREVNGFPPPRGEFVSDGAVDGRPFWGKVQAAAATSDGRSGRN
jgi:hypothetical protein